MEWLRLLSKFNLRRICFVIITVLLCIEYLKTYKQHKKITDLEETKQIESNYQKNEQGLYPWEADTDNTVERISKEAKPYRYDNGPKRGRW